MTHPSTIARDSAQHCEAIKYAFRQSKDGMVVSFVLHPSSVPPALQLAQIGARFMLAFVEIGDDETPINRKEAKTSAEPSLAPKPALDPDPLVRAPRKWDEITPAQQAGIRCNEPAFVKFLTSQYSHRWGWNQDIRSTKDAEDFVRHFCGVESRRDIRDGGPLAKWQQLEGEYRAWMFAPSFGAGAA